MCRKLQCLAILYLIWVVTSDDRLDADDDDTNYDLGKLYEEPVDYLDPHDMLAHHGQKKGSIKDVRGAGSFASGRWTPEDEAYMGSKESCPSDSNQVVHIKEQLSICEEHVSKLEQNVEAELQKSLGLQKKIMQEGSIDMQAFYSRFIHHLWHLLHLEEAQQFLKDGSSTLIRHLNVQVTKDDLDDLQQYLRNQHRVHKVDEFLHGAFTLEDPPEESTSNMFNSILAMITKSFEVVKNVEIWLYILCIGFLVLSLWAVSLFIQDIQKELRWGRVLCMMMVIIFFICCLWHWRHMHKVAESRRHAQMVKRGFTDMPEECKPGTKGTAGNVFDWLKITVFGAPDVCERYFEELMVDPTEEITPAMVIAETLARFFFQPLQHLGSEMAKLITNFYNNVPVIYHVPATILFVVLLVIILFYISGYGIDFPLWMGGIRPIYRTDSADTSEVDRITREAVAQLNQDRERFMEESRTMLTDITRAAISTQSQVDIQPLLLTSASILENQLERLISRKLAEVIPKRGITYMSTSQPLHINQETAQNDSGVFTVTSTPVRVKYMPQDNMEMLVGENMNQSKAMGVSTDAVHYRLTDSPRKKVLISKDESSSTSSPVASEGSSTVSFPRAYDREEEQQSSDREVEQQSSSGVSINRDRSPSSSSAQSHSSTQSLNQENYIHAHQENLLLRGSDEPDNEGSTDASTTGFADEFFYQVRSVLEDSVNSSLNDSSAPSNKGTMDDIRRRPDTSQNSSQEELEVELSGSGVRFLKTVENIMTP